MNFSIPLHVKLLIWTFVFMNCSYAGNLDSPPQIKRFHEIIRKIEQNVYETFDLVPIASGGRAHEKIENIDISFKTSDNLTIEEARILSVRVSELFLDIINKEPDAKDLLYHYPFLPEDITVLIRLNDVYHQERDYKTLGDNLARVFVCRGFLFYGKYIPSKVGSVDILKEPFEEAAKIVHQGEADKPSSTM